MQLAQRIAIGYMRAKLNFMGVFSKRKAARMAMVIFSTPYRNAHKKMPDVFRKSEPLTFHSSGKKISGFRWNHPSTKRLLIIHGFESSSFNFDAYVMPMIRNGYEVVAIDAPAHGRSEGKTIMLPEYVETIREAELRYGPFDAYMAHSFGGLAVSMFLEHATGKKDSKLVLIAPATETITAVRTFFDFLQLDQGIREQFNTLILEKTGFPPAHFSIKRIAAHLPGQVLWIHDEEDDLTPLSDALPIRQAGYPNIRFHITKGLGHRRIYRDPAVRNLIMDFFRNDADLDIFTEHGTA
jgi:pimeloyl-ACP methyl ester carboxylesterase